MIPLKLFEFMSCFGPSRDKDCALVECSGAPFDVTCLQKPSLAFCVGRLVLRRDSLRKEAQAYIP